VAAVVGLIVYFSFVLLGDDGRGTVVGGLVGIVAIVIRICWPLRREWWFWCVILILMVIQLVIIKLFDWSFVTKWTGLTLIPVMAAETAFTLLVVYTIYRSIYGSPSILVEDYDRNYSDRN
jgi:magnesium-transporting ATPase (P-type)